MKSPAVNLRIGPLRLLPRRRGAQTVVVEDALWEADFNFFFVCSEISQPDPIYSMRGKLLIKIWKCAGWDSTLLGRHRSQEALVDATAVDWHCEKNNSCTLLLFNFSLNQLIRVGNHMRTLWLTTKSGVKSFPQSNCNFHIQADTDIQKLWIIVSRRVMMSLWLMMD